MVIKSEALALGRVVEILGKTVIAIEPDKGSSTTRRRGEDFKAGAWSERLKISTVH